MQEKLYVGDQKIYIGKSEENTEYPKLSEGMNVL
jgi:hypothetical protein